MQQRISPATIIACVALFFSLGLGTGIAASGYRITSLWQISPKVRRELRGATGPRGLAGPTGPAGPQGAPGSSGVADEYAVRAQFALTRSEPDATAVARCHSGDYLVGGGVGGTEDNVEASQPLAQLDPGAGWEATGRLASAPQSFTADTTAGSETLTSATGSVIAGMEIFGPGIAAGTTATTVNGSITLSAPATQTISGDALSAQADGIITAWALCLPS